MTENNLENIPQTPKYSIIIPVKGKTLEQGKDSYLSMCLSSIRKHTPKSLYELIIIDDTPAPENSRWKYGQKNNYGATLAKGEWLVFLNDDCVVTPGWLEIFDKFFSDETSFKDSGIKPGLIGFSGIFFSGPQSAFNGFTNSIYPHKRVVTACAAVKRSVFEQVNGFDMDWPCNNYTDDDLSIRVWEAGYTNLIFPHYVFHFSGKSFDTKDIWKTDMAEGKKAMAKKFGEDWESKHYKDMVKNSAAKQ